MEFQLRGHDIHESIPGARTRAQAERAESAIREAIYNGKYNKATQSRRFSEFIDEVYLPWAKRNKASWRNDESRAKALKQFFGNRPVRDITPMLIRRLKNDLLVEKSKNSRPRTIPMTPRVRTELLRVIQGRAEGPIFSSPRTGVNLKEIKKGFKKAWELAGIPYGQVTPGGLTFHDLRHTFATRLADRGVDESVRMALLGQSSLKMVRRYSHATPEAIAEAVGRLAHRSGDVHDFKRKQG